MGFPIPSPLGKLIGIALKLPSIFKLLPKLVKTKGGKIGIVVMLGAIAASAAIAKIKEKKDEVQQKLEADVQARIIAIQRDMATKSAEEQEKLKDELDTLQAVDLTDVPMSEEEVKTMVDAKIEEVEPQIITALAPFTALIGFPIFVIELMKRLEPFANLGEEVTNYLDQNYQDDDGGAAPGLSEHLEETKSDYVNEDGTARVEDPEALADGTPEPESDDDDTTTTTTTTGTPTTGTPTTGTPTSGGTVTGGGADDGQGSDENEDPFFDDEYMKWE